jgi:hypothetical protein
LPVRPLEVSWTPGVIQDSTCQNLRFKPDRSATPATPRSELHRRPSARPARPWSNETRRWGTDPPPASPSPTRRRGHRPAVPRPLHILETRQPELVIPGARDPHLVVRQINQLADHAVGTTVSRHNAIRARLATHASTVPDRTQDSGTDRSARLSFDAGSRCPPSNHHSVAVAWIHLAVLLFASIHQCSP